MTESEAKKIIKLLERISNQLSTISEDVAYVLAAKRRGIGGKMRRSRNCSNSHASAFRRAKNNAPRGLSPLLPLGPSSAFMPRFDIGYFRRALIVVLPLPDFILVAIQTFGTA